MATTSLVALRPALVGYEPERTLYASHIKRAMDLALAVPLLVASIPIIAILSLMVIVTSGWPAFYRGERLGRNGVPFKILKLRTMVRGAETRLDHWLQENPSLEQEYLRGFKLRDDPRITACGRFLRKTSLDEILQLWNVLAGEMSLVGPRPIVQAELSHYGYSATYLLSTRPGVTGAWQVQGRNRIEYPERAWLENRIRLDTFVFE